MGFLEWMGLKSAKPDYGEAQSVYKRMMDMGDIDKMRASRMQDWKQMQGRAFGDIQKGVQSQWGGTGADILGVESGIPGQRTTEASSRWMQDVGNPMTRSIEQEWLQGTQQQKMAAEQSRQQLEEQARAEAASKTGAGLGLLGTVGGAAASFIPGVGSVLGPAIMGLSQGIGGGGGGGGQQQQNLTAQQTAQGSPFDNYYLKMMQQWMQNQGNPVYSPDSTAQGYGGHFPPYSGY